MASQSKLISWVGNASYSIYLTHVQFERVALDVMQHLSAILGELIQLSGSTMLLIATGTATLGGILLHKTVEQPILDNLQSVQIVMPYHDKMVA